MIMIIISNNNNNNNNNTLVIDHFNVITWQNFQIKMFSNGQLQFKLLIYQFNKKIAKIINVDHEVKNNLTSTLSCPSLIHKLPQTAYVILFFVVCESTY